MTILKGKGIWLWRVENDSIATIVKRVKGHGFSHIIVKIADGNIAYNTQINMKDLFDALLAEGIDPWGYQFVYGYNPSAEADIAKSLARNLTNMKGFVVDAEGAYKKRYNQAVLYMDAISGIKIPIAVTSYRYPHYHRTFPWKEFLSRCDIYMPQVYWAGSHNAGDQLLSSMAEIEQLLSAYNIHDVQISPIGAAYCEWGWCPTLNEVMEFSAVAEAQGISAISFWEMEAARTRLPSIWKCIQELKYDPTVSPPVPPTPPTVEKIMVTLGAVNMRSLPVVTNATKRAITYYGKTFDVIEEVKDSYGNTWYRVPVYISGSCVKEV